MTDHLIIFTRYPVAGKTKTRLIPALGADGAARLQQQLTERLVAVAHRLEERLGTTTSVHYQDGSETEMAGWLGQVECVKQAAGHIGLKMQAALQSAFAAGASRAVLVGTDIPELDIAILEQAFAALKVHDAVIGPSRDGGYYLIGMAAAAAPRLFAPLFADMVWSTGEVFAVTMTRLAGIGQAAAVLPKLADIDRPEDLPLAQSLGLL